MTFRGLKIWDLGIIGLGFVNLGNWEDLVLEQLRKWARDVRSGTRARTEHGRSGDPGLWVCNEEKWDDRRVMTANTRVRGLRRVSRSSSIRRP